MSDAAPAASTSGAPLAAAKPKRVRRKPADGDAAPVKRRRKKGSLSRLGELSLELVEIVCGFLDPGSLLAIARTTKSWRQFLLTKATGQHSACARRPNVADVASLVDSP